MSIRTQEPRPITPPTWEDYWADVDSQEYLTARHLIELSGSVRGHFAQFVAYEDHPVMVDVPGRPSYDPGEPDPDGWVYRDVTLDWQAAAAADAWACSSTERRLLDIVLSLIQPELDYDHDGNPTGLRLVDLRTLSELGSWQDDAATIFVGYMVGHP